MKRSLHGLFTSLFRLRFALAIALAWIVVYYLVPWLVPLPGGLTQPPRPGVELTDRAGRPLRKLLIAGQRVDQPLEFSDLPPALVKAVVSAEDQRFWHHGGIDFVGLIRAALDSAEARRPVSGASTITQQLVKVARGRYANRSWRDKVCEVFTARRIEMVWDKKRIVTEYLQRVEFGNQCTGCASAARGYFRKPLEDLSLAECAFLAGLPRAPSRLNPHRNFDAAKRRQEWVLGRMREDRHISADQEKAAAAEPLVLLRWTGGFEAPHFVEMLMQSPAWSSLAETGAPVRTGLDLELQQFCERAVKDRMARLREHNAHDAAVVVIDNTTGGIRALIGSPDYFDEAGGQINGALAARSAGSTLKPFTYLLAFEGGAAPATVVDDLPVEFVTPTGLYRPENYDRKSHGPVSYREALANSLNISAVRVLQQIGGPAVLQSALQAVGLGTLADASDHYGLGLTIGNAEARLLELANAYACLARLGEWRPTTMLDGETSAGGRRVFDRASCWLIADILSDNHARVRGFGLNSPLRLPFPAAVKTGTSTDFRDNWCVGFTPQFTVAVWIGNFDRRPMTRVSGVTGAAPLWREIFMWLDRRHGSTWFAADPDVVEADVDSLTGEPVPESLAGRRPTVREKFHVSTAPATAPAARYDSLGRVLLPREYARWLVGPDNWLGAQAVVGLEPSLESPLRITSPLAGSTILLDPDLPESGRRLRLRTNFPDAATHWSSETLPIEQNSGAAMARLAQGRHRITARNTRTGDTTETWVNVKSL